MFRTIASVAVATLLLLAGPAAAAPPGGGTQTPSPAQAGSTATLYAFLSSDDGSVTYSFEYGTTTAYGSRTPEVTAAASSGQSVQQNVTGLSPNTTYHVRVRARNSSPGELIGDDKTFTTSAASGADTDGDGYLDSSDACPTVPGGTASAANPQGCPPNYTGDSDGDGFIDTQDGCPTKPGVAQGPQNQAGCPPPPDTDGDGLPDSMDSCPAVAAPASSGGLGGCPPPPSPDRDADGVPNQYDECPDQAGSRDAAGCPDADGDWVRDSQDACPNLKGSHAEGGGDGCPDKDGDSVKDSDDACLKQSGVGDPKGCPKVIGRFNFPTGNTYEMAQPGEQLAICDQSPNEADCTWRIKVTLTAASARQLGLKDRVLVDTTVTTTKKSAFFHQVRGTYQWRPSKALRAALKTSKKITVVLSGSFKYAGSDGFEKMEEQRIVVKPKPCGFNKFACT